MHRTLELMRADRAQERAQPAARARRSRSAARTRARRPVSNVELSVTGAPRPLPAGVELSAYRIVQEALTNVIKHSGSDRASVELRYGRDGLELEILDNGERRRSVRCAIVRPRAGWNARARGAFRRTAPGWSRSTAAVTVCWRRCRTPDEPDPSPDRRRPAACPRRVQGRARGHRRGRGRRRGAGRRAGGGAGPAPRSRRRADGHTHAGNGRDRGDPHGCPTRRS